MQRRPYLGRPQSEWVAITKRLVAEFPLGEKELVSATEAAWADLYTASFGVTGLRIGSEIFLPAQATGVILERLIAVHLHKQYPEWRSGNVKAEKDVVNDKNDDFSFEIKTSSSVSGLYGNRSTGHRSEERSKFRTGYYLVINYKLPTEPDPTRKLRSIRFGWIDDEDWIGQTQPTGQQASIGAVMARLKLITIKQTG